jgi:hypothetical protein
MTSAELVAELRSVSRLGSQEECARFIELTIAVARRRDPAVLDELLDVIDDATGDVEVMAELWRALEDVYPPSLFVPALLRSFESMIRKAPDTTFYLHARLLNDPDPRSFELYLAGLPSLSPRARTLLEELLATPFEPRYPARVNQVNAALVERSP